MPEQKPDYLNIDLSPETLENWPSLNHEQKKELFFNLSDDQAEDFFLQLGANDQYTLIEELELEQKAKWLRLLAPDDAADLIQLFPIEDHGDLLYTLNSDIKAEVQLLLSYDEDDAGGIMNPRFARLRPEATVDASVRYLRQQVRHQVETIRYAYVVGESGELLGSVSFRDLLLSEKGTFIKDIMTTDLITIPEDMDQEEVSRKFTQHALTAIPVVDEDNRIKGIITIDDVVDVVEEEATEDIQKLGGTEALDKPYLEVGLLSLIRKRAVWLVVLFISEMFTATAMGYYEDEIQKAVVLALFIPLIISSGGNSGSQASTLIIRAMALGEVRLKDWWRVFFREVATGVSLGVILGSIGLLRIIFWPSAGTLYGEHYMLVALAVSLSLIGIVLWGTLCGSMLPFLLRSLKFDPATASAPFVATLVDVTGIIIYFSVASMVLGGKLNF